MFCALMGLNGSLPGPPAGFVGCAGCWFGTPVVATIEEILTLLHPIAFNE